MQKRTRHPIRRLLLALVALALVAPTAVATDMRADGPSEMHDEATSDDSGADRLTTNRRQLEQPL